MSITIRLDVEVDEESREGAFLKTLHERFIVDEESRNEFYRDVFRIGLIEFARVLVEAATELYPDLLKGDADVHEGR